MSDSSFSPAEGGCFFLFLGNSQVSGRDTSSTDLESGAGEEGKSFNSEETLNHLRASGNKSNPHFNPLHLPNSQTCGRIILRPGGGCSDLPKHSTRTSRLQRVFERRT